MTRAFRYKNFGVYIGDERGERHHMPHAHIKERGTLICTVNLLTLKPLQRAKILPPGMFEELQSHQEQMLAEWEELNPDERD